MLQPWRHHLAGWYVGVVRVGCTLVRSGATSIVIAILSTSVVFLEFLITRPETAKTVAEHGAECLDARLTTLGIVFLR